MFSWKCCLFEYKARKVARQQEKEKRLREKEEQKLQREEQKRQRELAKQEVIFEKTKKRLMQDVIRSAKPGECMKVFLWSVHDFKIQ